VKKQQQADNERQRRKREQEEVQRQQRAAELARKQNRDNNSYSANSSSLKYSAINFIVLAGLIVVEALSFMLTRLLQLLWMLKVFSAESMRINANNIHFIAEAGERLALGCLAAKPIITNEVR